MAFRKVATLDELWDGEMMVREIEGHVVLLVNVGSAIQAFVDCCPHLGTRLSQGSLINPRKACLDSFAVKVENGDILIDVDARELKA
jgi:toluene monooxygenase system ferredoxin subunit